MNDNKPLLYALLGAGGTLLVVGLLVAGIAIGRSGNDDGTVESATIPTPAPTTSSTSTTTTTSPTTTTVASTTTTSSTTTTTSTTTTSTTTTTTSTTTTVPPTTTTPTTTVPPTTTSPTTTTTTVPEPFVIDLSTPQSGSTYRNAETSLPWRALQSTWWYSGRIHARAGVGPTGSEELVSEASIWSDFVADGPNGTLRATVSYEGSLVTLASFGSGTAVEIQLGVYELNGSAQGGRIAARTVLDEEILAEAIQSVSNVTFDDSESYTIDLALEQNQAYRVRLDLRCEARAAFALSATLCDFGPLEPEDTGSYAGWSDVTVTFPG